MEEDRPASLRHRTVERALGPSYAKSSEQVEQILRAAVELIRDTETRDLRVTDVIAAAGVYRQRARGAGR